jgi:CRP-like cAMP-binding protein
MNIDIAWMEENVLLHKLHEDEARLINDLFNIHQFETGDEIITQGESGKGIYLLRSGEAGVTSKKAGQATFLGEVGEGAVVGEMSFFSGGDSSASITAYKPCTAYELSRDNYCKLLTMNPELLMAFLTHLVSYSSAIVKKMNQAHVSTMAR